MNLTPWDVQSKQIHSINDVSPPLYSGECRYGGGEIYILVINDDGKQTDYNYGVSAESRRESAWHRMADRSCSNFEGGAAAQYRRY